MIAAVNLTTRAEEEFRREAERVGGLVIDRDEALRSTAAANFSAEIEGVIAAVVALGGKRAVA